MAPKAGCETTTGPLVEVRVVAVNRVRPSPAIGGVTGASWEPIATVVPGHSATPSFVPTVSAVPAIPSPESYGVVMRRGTDSVVVDSVNAGRWIVRGTLVVTFPLSQVSVRVTVVFRPVGGLGGSEASVRTSSRYLQGSP